MISNSRGGGGGKEFLGFAAVCNIMQLHFPVEEIHQVARGAV